MGFAPPTPPEQNSNDKKMNDLQDACDNKTGVSSNKTFTGSGLSTEKLSCPNCGDTLELKSDSSKTATCPSCGSCIDISKNDVIGKSNPKKFLPWSHLKIGITGKFKAVEYQIVGRVRFRGNGYEFWDEWMLLSRKGKIMWLSEDSGNFFLLDSFIPVGDVDVEATYNGATYVKWDGTNALVYEKGSAKIEHVEGELSWRAKIGESIRYIDAKKGKTKLSCEIEEDEVKFFKGLNYTPTQVYHAFDIKDPIPPIPYDDDDDDLDEDDYTVNWDAIPKPLKDTALLCTIFGVILLFCGFFLYSEGVLVHGSSLGQEANKIEDYVESKAFELKKPGGVYALKTFSRLNTSSNTWAWCQAVLVDVDDETTPEPKIIVKNEFWFESGYDSDGRWTESDTRHCEYFKINKAGKYKLRLYGESQHAASQVFASINKNAINRSLMTFWGIILLVLGIGLYIAMSTLYKERNDTF